MERCCQHIGGKFVPVKYAQPSGNSSFAFYERIFADQKGVIGAFENDFLWYMAVLFPQFTQTVDGLYLWAKGMNDAALGANISVQYCMDLPSFALASVEFDAVTNARGSTDNFPSDEDAAHNNGQGTYRRWQIAYAALMYNALGLQPFMDVIWTTASQPGNIANHGAEATRKDLLLEATVTALGSGPAGIGDGPGYTNATVAMMLCMQDGTLLHGSSAATPIDAMLHPSLVPGGGSKYSTPEVWAAPSVLTGADPGGLGRIHRQWWSVLAVDLPSGGFELARNDLLHGTGGVAGVSQADELLAWRLHDPACADAAPASGCVRGFNSSAPLRLQTGGAASKAGEEHKFATFSMGPACGRFALLGELGKFVAVSPARLTRVDCATLAKEGKPPALSVAVAGAKGERVRLLFVVGEQLKVVELVVGEGGTAAVACDTTHAAGCAASVPPAPTLRRLKLDDFKASTYLPEDPWNSSKNADALADEAEAHVKAGEYEAAIASATDALRVWAGNWGDEAIGKSAAELAAEAMHARSFFWRGAAKARLAGKGEYEMTDALEDIKLAKQGADEAQDASLQAEILGALQAIQADIVKKAMGGLQNNFKLISGSSAEAKNPFKNEL